MSNKLKRILSSLMAAALAVSLFAGCSNGGEPANNPSTPSGDAPSNSAPVDTSGVKQIYFLNFKPEVAEVYGKIAADYEAETGIKIKVETAASGTYEQTLRSEIAKNDPPTIFQINGPVGYNTWKDYCADLSNTELYSHLSQKNLAVIGEDGKGVYGIPYAVEGYGIIYNNAIMDKYFALSDKAVSISSAEEIKNFDTLKQVADDMQKHAEELGIKGVFASTSLSEGNQWRWQTHLANMPLYYEFKDSSADGNAAQAGLNANEITFKYGDNFKNIFDLYMTDSLTEKGLLGGKSVNDAMSEFALGQCAMVQNGNWAWNEINGVEGNTVKKEDVKFMPIYTGVAGEEKQGICTGTENFFCINSKVDEATQKASADFLNWLFTSEKGKQYVLNDLKFIAPFDSFSASEAPDDPLAAEVARWNASTETENIPWIFLSFPSEQFKNDFGNALLEYANGTKDWDGVKQVVIDSWKAEKAAAAANA